MGPRGFTLPSAQTASAKSARSAFFCSLCQKGYTRMNEFEAHESSYDHLHKKRLKEMKEMQTQVGRAANKGKEEKGPLVKIQIGGKKEIGGETKGGGFKRGGFKSAFGPMENEETKRETVEEEGEEEGEEPMEVDEKRVEAEDSDVTDEDDYYDPRRPTGCTSDCRGRIQTAVG